MTYFTSYLQEEVNPLISIPNVPPDKAEQANEIKGCTTNKSPAKGQIPEKFRSSLKKLVPTTLLMMTALFHFLFPYPLLLHIGIMSKLPFC